MAGAVIVFDAVVQKLSARRGAGGRHGPQQHIDDEQGNGKGTRSNSIDEHLGLEISSRDHRFVRETMRSSEEGAFFLRRASREGG